MASWIETFAPSFAAGTDTTVPVRFSRDVRVDRLEMRFPPGSNGKLAVQILAAQQQLLPPVSGEFITASDEYLVWPLDGLLDTVQWSIRGVNSGTFAHTVFLRFLCSEIPEPSNTQGLSFGSSKAAINPLSL